MWSMSLKGIVNLLVQTPSPGGEVGGLSLALPLRSHGRARDLLPALESVSHLLAILGGGEEVVAFATEGRKHLIQVPCIPGSRTPAPELIGIRLPALAAPLTDGFVGHDYPACEQEFFPIPAVEAQAVVQPDAVGDDFGREAVVYIRVG
jgi:hypothetical protein